MANGLFAGPDLPTRLLPAPKSRLLVRTEVLDEPAPSLHPHYRTITGASPLLRAGPPAGAATVLSVSGFRRTTRSLSPPEPTGPGRAYRHPPSHVPCRRSRPGSRHLHAGHHLANQRAPARLVPETLDLSGFDVIFAFRRVLSGSLALPSRSPPDASRAPFPHRSPRRSSTNAA